MKDWVQFLLCVLFSACIWLVLNLSQTYVAIESVPVIAESNIDGRSGRSSSDATITAQVKATGFQHSAMSRARQRTKTVTFSASDFRHMAGEEYSISNSSLFKYASTIFGDGVSVESFVSEDAVFTFPEETHRKVPVKAVHSLTFHPQYMAMEEMTLQPDSVLIYGETSRLASIDCVLTKPIDLEDVRTSQHGSVKLDIPSGVRTSSQEAIYRLEVTRYVEVKADMRIDTRNVPHGSELSVLPSTATVVFRCVFPLKQDPVEEASFYVDYRDFAESMTGRCVAHADGIPSNVIDYKMTPEVFDCLLNAAE